MILPMTAPGIIDQLWPPIATYATSNITCMQLCTAVVKRCYRFITESLGAAHISLGRLPVFFSPSLHLSHTLILDSLHCFFSLTLLSSLYISVFQLSLCFTVSLSVFLSVGSIQGCMGYSKSWLLTAGCKDYSVNQSQQCGDTESCRVKGLGAGQ